MGRRSNGDAGVTATACTTTCALVSVSKPRGTQLNHNADVNEPTDIRRRHGLQLGSRMLSTRGRHREVLRSVWGYTFANGPVRL